MKKRNLIIFLLMLIGLVTTQTAWAHWRGHGGRHGGHIGVYIEPFPMWRYYPPPYYDYPPPVYVPPPPPPVYIEKEPAQSYWYYCTDPQGYYPTVRDCPEGWLKVLPQTQPNR